MVALDLSGRGLCGVGLDKQEEAEKANVSRKRPPNAMCTALMISCDRVVSPWRRSRGSSPRSSNGGRASVIDTLNRLEIDPGFVEPEEAARLIQLAATGQADELAGDASSIYDPDVRARLAATRRRVAGG
jgi:hypothetical protein